MEYLIDALGDFCPIPNLKVQKALSQTKAGDRIVLLTDHSCTVTTIKEEMRRRRLVPKVEEVENGIWRITITVG
ncbi:MAG TPA: sulfurtransferase TusA family protein [Selenomonadales bacterium]|nr:sulfurtransferase TusA family protein [Selenomonadales bacterium]